MQNNLVKTVFAKTLFDGISSVPSINAVVRIEGSKIASIKSNVEQKDIPADAVFTDIATPGLIDIQINGAGDIQFNSDLTVAGLKRMVSASQQGGAAFIFPTFTTAPGQSYQKAVKVVQDALAAGVDGIAGVHLEGPFLSVERPGIHRQDFIRPLDEADVAYLCDAARQIKILLTIAPEHQNPDFVKALAQAGIVLFAGHTNATFQDMQIALKSGVTGVTHLFNTMSQITARAPGVVGSVLGSEDFFAGIIADGYHVDVANLRLAAKAIPTKLCLVTDAMQTMNGHSQSFDLYGKQITLRNGKLTGDDNTLGGAHLAMAEAVRNMVRLANIDLGEAISMATRNPALAVGLDADLGTLAPNKSATLSLFDNAMECVGVVVNGSHAALDG